MISSHQRFSKPLICLTGVVVYTERIQRQKRHQYRSVIMQLSDCKVHQCIWFKALGGTRILLFVLTYNSHDFGNLPSIACSWVQSDTSEDLCLSDVRGGPEDPWSFCNKFSPWKACMQGPLHSAIHPALCITGVLILHANFSLVWPS